MITAKLTIHVTAGIIWMKRNSRELVPHWGRDALGAKMLVASQAK
jgi:hypothetical protein